MTSVSLTSMEQGERALALLNDPQQFADAYWEPIFGNDHTYTDALFATMAPKAADENRNEIMRLVYLAAITPGVDLGKVIGDAEDLLNATQWTYRDVGRVMGTCLEGIRHLMLTCYDEMRRIAEDDAKQETATLARLRAEIETKRVDVLKDVA
jgi:hypothetical protein